MMALEPASTTCRGMLESYRMEKHAPGSSTRTLTVGTGRVVVNGRQLLPNQIAMRLGSGNIEWRTGDVPVIVVTPDDDPLTTVTSVANAPKKR